MRKLVLPLAVLCILAFSAEAFAAQCGTCRRGPARRIVAAQPLQKTAGVVRGVGKGVGAAIKGTRCRIAGRVECRQDRRQARRCR